MELQDLQQHYSDVVVAIGAELIAVVANVVAEGAVAATVVAEVAVAATVVGPTMAQDVA